MARRRCTARYTAEGFSPCSTAAAWGVRPSTSARRAARLVRLPGSAPVSARTAENCSSVIFTIVSLSPFAREHGFEIPLCPPIKFCAHGGPFQFLGHGSSPRYGTTVALLMLITHQHVSVSSVFSARPSHPQRTFVPRSGFVEIEIVLLFFLDIAREALF